MTVGAQQRAFFNFLKNIFFRAVTKHTANIFQFIFFVVKIKRRMVKNAVAHLTFTAKQIY